MAKTARALTPLEWRELSPSEFVDELKIRELAEEKQAFIEKTSAAVQKAVSDMREEFGGKGITPEAAFARGYMLMAASIWKLERRIKAMPNPMQAGFREQNRRIQLFHEHLESQELRLRARIDSLHEEVFGPE